MRMLTAAVAAALLLPAHVAAHAAPVTVQCALVRDPTGDAVGLAQGVDSPKSADSMDITQLDLATNAGQLTAVVRTYALNRASVEGPTGRRYTFAFTVRGTSHTITMLLAADATAESDLGIPPVVDDKAYELRITVPLARFKLHNLTTRQKDWFVELSGSSQRWAGDLKSGYPVPDDTKADQAKGSVRYVHRARSCVSVGK